MARRAQEGVGDLERALAQWRERVGEFPVGAADAPTAMARRDFVRLLGASVALAGLGACVREPSEQILPYVHKPPGAVPGVAMYFATAMSLDGYATGLVVESHDGRPTKIEGNPDHPASLGAAGVLEQASLLQLYDPHRARHARAGNRRTSWDAVATAFGPTTLTRRAGARGAGLRLLLEPTSSPLVAELLARFQTMYPDARVYFHAPLAAAGPLASAQRVLGAALLPQYDLTQADVVVALSADVLASGAFHLRHAHDFASRRRAGAADASARQRLFVAESSPSPTGTLADQRLAASPRAIAQLAAALVAAVGEDPRLGGRMPAVVTRGASATVALTPAEHAWVSAAAAALVGSGGRAVVIAGERTAAEVHAMAHALNAAVGAVGRTTWYASSPLVEAGAPSHDLGALVHELAAGTVDTLVIAEGNPAYAAPADLEAAGAIRSARNVLYLGAYDDETARLATWHVPAAHYLEAWGDARAYDGTLSLVQPLIAPMYGGRTIVELLAVMAGQGMASAHDLLRDAHRASQGKVEENDRWDDALRRGVVADSAFPRRVPRVKWEAVADAYATLAAARPRESIEIAFVPDASVYDGRFADNAWLQELPDPTTKLTWGNAALMSPASAARLTLQSADAVTLRLHDRAIAVPALIVPGHADDVVTLSLGYGRTGAEAVARGIGANANAIRTSAAPYSDMGLAIAARGGQQALAVTQTHWSLEGRDASILGPAPLPPAPPSPPPSAPVRIRRPLTLYEPPAPAPDGFGADQWAMTIDLDACTGCSACVVACQAENNIPVVGREGVLASREMHWMRIDRYLSGPDEAPTIVSQPMLCQHCEKAPCEYVCPVNATVHSDDGLNEMVYNRCVGTRFCSNNCPYKVRRFNWFDYNAEIAETERMAKNPDVTVRARGVMEKCTFCVQRVRRAQVAAELEGAPRTGPVMTACMQTCPTQAIVFGSLTDPTSDVARLRTDPRAFSALAELGTEPRVRYLARRGDASP